MSEVDRVARIVTRYAKRRGLMAAVYANANSFDLMTERKQTKKKSGGILWTKRSTGDVYRSPLAVAVSMARDVRKSWDV